MLRLALLLLEELRLLESLTLGFCLEPLVLILVLLLLLKLRLELLLLELRDLRLSLGVPPALDDDDHESLRLDLLEVVDLCLLELRLGL